MFCKTTKPGIQPWMSNLLLDLKWNLVFQKVVFSLSFSREHTHTCLFNHVYQFHYFKNKLNYWVLVTGQENGHLRQETSSELRVGVTVPRSRVCALYPRRCWQRTQHHACLYLVWLTHARVMGSCRQRSRITWLPRFYCSLNEFFFLNSWIVILSGYEI